MTLKYLLLTSTRCPDAIPVPDTIVYCSLSVFKIFAAHFFKSYALTATMVFFMEDNLMHVLQTSYVFSVFKFSFCWMLAVL